MLPRQFFLSITVVFYRSELEDILLQAQVLLANRFQTGICCCFVAVPCFQLVVVCSGESS